MTQASTALSARNHALFWCAAFALFLLFVRVFGDTLLPFVLGIAIAYLLNPIVKWLGAHKVPRGLAALSILGLFVVFIVALLGIATPLLYHQAAAFADAAPGYIDRLVNYVSPYIAELQARTDSAEAQSALQETLKNNIGKVLNMGAGVLGTLASGGQAFAGFMTVAVLTPIVSFFIMREWNRIAAWIDGILPRHSYDDIKGLLCEIDRKISGFVRGQITIAFLLGALYAIALSFAGLNFGFLIGIMAGVLSIIPLVGSTVGLLTATVVAWLQSGELTYTGIIAAIFIGGQLLEGNVITPKILGESVGLHPLWIMFALMAGASVFGLVGMLLAVPVAAVIGVLGSYALTKYRESPYYNDGKQAKSKA